MGYLDLLWGTITHPVDTAKAVWNGTNPDWQLTGIQSQAAADITQASAGNDSLAESEILQMTKDTSAAFAQGNAEAAKRTQDQWAKALTWIEWIVGIGVVLYALGLGLKIKRELP